MPFTPDEVQSAIQKLVATSIRRPYGALGTRSLDLPFADYQQSAASVFMLHPKAPFYVLYLAAIGALQEVQAVASLAENLLQAVGACGRVVLPVEDLSPLANARAALQDLEGATYLRKGGLTDVTKVPAYQRFKTNVEQFLAKAGGGVKLNGDVVMTPQEARAAIPGLMRELKQAMGELVVAVRRLAGGLGDMGSVNLPALVASGIIARAREVLGGHVTELAKLSPEERLSKMRQVVLELLASKATVKTFGSLKGPSSYLTVNGTGVLFSDAAHPATPAVAQLDGTPPYGVYAPPVDGFGKNMVDLFVDVPGPLVPKAIDHGPLVPLSTTTALLTLANVNVLTAGVAVGDVVYPNSGLNAGGRWTISMVVNSSQVQVSTPLPTSPDPGLNVDIYRAPTAALTLSSSYVADIRGQNNGDYDFHAVPSDNRPFKVRLDWTGGTVTVSVTFAIDQFTTADEAASQFNAAVPLGRNVQAGAYFSTLKFKGVVLTITSLGGNDARLTGFPNPPSSYGIQNHDQVTTALDAEVFGVSAVGANYVDIQGSSPPTLGSNVAVEIGLYRRLHIFCPYPDDALATRAKLTIVDETATRPACTLLGFPFGAFSQSRPSTAKEVVEDINNKTTKVLAGTAFELSFESLARTVPLAPTTLVFYKWRGLGFISESTGAGPFTIKVNRLEMTSAEVEVGDVLVLREGASVNRVFTLTGFDGDLLVAEGAVAPDPLDVDVNLEMEIGPSFTVSYGALVHISGGPNGGDYYIDSQGSVPIEVVLQSSLPLPSLRSQPVLLPLCAVGIERVAVASLDKTTTSYIFVREPRPLLTATNSAEGFMSTPWFLLPEVPQPLDQGDLLELYRDLYNVPSESFTIEEVERDTRVLLVSPELTPTLLSYTFSETTQPPFARLRAGRAIDWDAFERKLEGWLLTAPGSVFFADLTRLVSPLLVNKSPTAAQVNDARNKVIALAKTLTVAGAALAGSSADAALETILGTYSVDPVHAVDTLLKSYAERGLDRAIDLLLSAQFTAFFNLTADGASYTGDLMEKARRVAQKDMPVSKVDRTEATESEAANVAESPDFEYDVSDTEEG